MNIDLPYCRSPGIRFVFDAIARVACNLPGVVLVLTATALTISLSAEDTAMIREHFQEQLDEADAVFNARQYEQATDLYKTLAARAELGKDEVVQVQALAMAARGHLIRGEAQAGQVWIDKAARLASPSEPLGWSRYLGVRGRFESHGGNDVQATKTFKAMYDFCVSNGQYSRAIDAAHMIALTGTLEEQIQWAKKGIQAAEQGEENQWLGPLWNNLGITYWTLAIKADAEQALAYNREAVECYKKARHYHNEYGNEFSAAVADWALGSAYRRTGEFDIARSLLNRVKDWASIRYHAEPTDENGEWVGLADMELGLIEFAKNQPGQSLSHLENAHILLARVNMQEWDLHAWTLLEDTLEKLRSRNNRD
jgi:tetratricopeptide (TPR) repeat protein